YNMVPAIQQREAVERLIAEPPRLALLSADNMDFDEPLSLRTHRLYRFVIHKYRPVAINGIIIGLLNDRVTDFSDQELSLLDRVFSPGNLLRIPMAWGRSHRTLTQAMTDVIQLDPEAADLRDLAVISNGRFQIDGLRPTFDFDLAEHSLAGTAAGLLWLDCDLPTSRNALRLSISWSSNIDGPTTGGATASLAPGISIVPLDAFPRWLTAKHLHKLEITIEGLQSGDIIALRGIGLFQRNNVMSHGGKH
ncbi:MAG: hypothetical protein ABR497_08240, partial [Kiritimatiellia bacterium]